MIPNKIPFKPVTQRDGARLRRYYENCDYELCEYSLGTKLMWRKNPRERTKPTTPPLQIRREIGIISPWLDHSDHCAE